MALCNVRTDRTSPRGDDIKHTDVPWMWARVEWAAHPRQLWLASRQHVSLLDVRCRASAVACIRCLAGGDNIVASWNRASDGAGEVVTALTRHPGNPAQALVATSRSIQLIDCRAPRAPLLCWPHHLGKSSATTLQLERNLDSSLRLQRRGVTTDRMPETQQEREEQRVNVTQERDERGAGSESDATLGLHHRVCLETSSSTVVNSRDSEAKDQANIETGMMAGKSSAYNASLRNKKVALCRLRSLRLIL